MKKNKNITKGYILGLTIIITILFLLFSMTKIYAAPTDDIDIRLTISGKENLDISEVQFISSRGNYLFEVDIEMKSSSSKTEIREFQAGITNTYSKYLTDVEYNSSITSIKGLDASDNEVSMFQFTAATSGYFGMTVPNGVVNMTDWKSVYYLNTEYQKIATMRFKVPSEKYIFDSNFMISLDITHPDYSFMGNLGEPHTGPINIHPVRIGQSGPDATLKDITVSDMPTFSGVTDGATNISAATITYADSLKDISDYITFTKSKSSATATLQIKDDLTRKKAKEGDVIEIVVDDSGTILTHTVIITKIQEPDLSLDDIVFTKNSTVIVNKNDLENITVSIPDSEKDKGFKATINKKESYGTLTATISTDGSTKNLAINSSGELEVSKLTKGTHIITITNTEGNHSKTYKITVEQKISDSTATVSNIVVDKKNSGSISSATINEKEIAKLLKDTTSALFKITFNESTIKSGSYVVSLLDSNDAVIKSIGNGSLSGTSDVFTASNIISGLEKGSKYKVDFIMIAENGDSISNYFFIEIEKSDYKELKADDFKTSGDTGSVEKTGNIFSYIIQDNSSSNIIFDLNPNGNLAKEKGTFYLKTKEGNIIPGNSINANDLLPGEHEYKVLVTAQDETTIEYDLVIKKLSEDITFSIIVTNGATTLISNDRFTLEESTKIISSLQKILYEYKTITVVLATTHEKATIEYISGNMDFESTANKKGRTITGKITYNQKTAQEISTVFKVTAENKKSQEYTVKIGREAAETINLLETLTINDTTVKGFESNKIPPSTYGKIIITPIGTQTIYIDAIMSANKYAAEIIFEYSSDGVTWVDGQSIAFERGKVYSVRVRTTSQAEESRLYQFQVVVADMDNEIVNIDLKDSLTNELKDANGIPYSFAKSTLTYNLKVNAPIDKINLIVTLSSQYASYVIKNGNAVTTGVYGTGSITVNLGSTGTTTSFTVIATSEAGDESTSVYTFNIERGSYRNDTSIGDVFAVFKNASGQEIKEKLTLVQGAYSILKDPTYEFVRIEATLPQTVQGQIFVGSDNGSTTNYIKSGTVVRGKTPTIFDIEVKPEDPTKSSQKYKVNVQIASSNADLNNITIDNQKYTVFPVDLGTLAYTKAQSFKIEYELADLNAEASFNYTIIGEKWDLGSSVGKITLKVTVTAEDGKTKKEYNVSLNRQDQDSTNTLSSLELMDTEGNNVLSSLNLTPTVLLQQSNFEITVNRDVILKNFIYTVTKDTAKVSLPTDLSLSAGSYVTLVINVTAENGSVKTYQIKVNQKNSNADISSIDVSNNSLLNQDLDLTKLIFDLGKVAHTDRFITFIINMEDQFSTYEIKVVKGSGKINGNVVELLGKNNTISITGIAEDGTKDTKVYEIDIEKNDAEENRDIDDIKVILGSTEVSGDPYAKGSNYSVVVDRNANEVTVRVYLLTSEKKTIISNHDGLSKSVEDLYDIYTFIHHLKSGDDNSLSIIIRSEAGVNKTHTLKVVTKSVDDSIRIDIIDNNITYDFDSHQIGTTKDLGTFVFSKKDLTFRIEKSDYAILYVNGKVQTLDNNGEFIFTLEQLKLGETNKELSIYVLSEFENPNSSNKKEYKFKYKQEKASDDAVIKSIIARVDDEDILSKQGVVFNPSELVTIVRIDRFIGSKTISIDVESDKNGKLSNGNKTLKESKPLVIGKNTFSYTVTSESGASTQTYFLEVYVANDTNDVLGIKVGNKDVPDFKQEKSDYIITESFLWNQANVNVNVTTASNSYAHIIGNGSTALVYGENTIYVTVRSEYRQLINDITEDKNYEILVNRNNPYKDVNLNELYVQDESDSLLSFDDGIYKEGKYNYVITLAESQNISGINIYLTRKDNRQMLIDISEGGFYKDIIITDGKIKEEIKFTVKAEDGAEKEYTITIVKGTSLSNDNKIKSVSLTDLFGIEYMKDENLFEDGKVEYKVTVDYNVTNLILNIMANSSTAVVTGSQTYTLMKTETTIKFYVTAENKVKGTEYTIIVTRNQPSENANLDDLEAVVNGEIVLGENGTKLVFDKDTNTYKLELSRNAQFIKITPKLSDSKSALSGTYINELLNPGINQFVVTVTPEAGQSYIKNYYIIVTVANEEIEIDNLEIDGFNIQHDPKVSGVVYDLGSVSSKDQTINIEASIPNDSFGTLKGTGLKNLKYGINEFIVEAISENGKNKVSYTIRVIRNSASDDATLKELTITVDSNEIILGLNSSNPTKLVFDPEVFTYNLFLTRKSQKVNIQSELNDKNASPTYSHNFNRSLNLEPGDNKYTITVKAEDGITAEVYTINIKVANKDIEVEELSVVDFNFSYFKNIFEYDLGEVESTVQAIDIAAKISDEFGKITGTGRQTLIDGINTFKVIATSEDGSQKVEYTIKVTRKKSNNNGTPTNSDAELYDLSVKGLITDDEYVLNYDTDTMTYNIELGFTDTHAVIKTLQNNLSTVIGEGNYKIEPGETKQIIIQVTASDGTKGKVYTINLTRKQGDDNTDLDRLYIVEKGVERELDVSLDYQKIVIDSDTSEIEIKAISSSDKSTVNGLGVKVTKLSEQIFIVSIKSETNKEKQYVISVLKADNNADLNSLDVFDENGNNLQYDPIFSPNTNVYNIDLSNNPSTTEIEISAIAFSKVAKVSGNGIFTLQSGVGETTERFYIDVTAEDQTTTKRYTIIVKRNVKAEDDITIDEFKLHVDSSVYLSNDLKDGVLQFKASQKSYTIDVPFSSKKAVIAFSNSNGARLNGKNEYTLNDKETIITFSITSQSGKVSSDEYTITIVKEDPSTDNLLEQLSVNGTRVPGFDPNIFEYEVIVDSDKIDKVFISGLASDSKSTILGFGEKTLSKGLENVFEIIVTPESGSGDAQTYKLVVKSQSFNANLANLGVLDYDMTPIFDVNHTTYTVNVPYSPKIDIEIFAQAENEKATINGTGIKRNLSVGSNIFVVYAIAQSGKQGTRYQIDVVVEEPSDDNTLKKLVVKDKSGNILPFVSVFEPNVEDYFIMVSEDLNIMSVIIEAEANNKSATVYGAGNQKLEAEVNGKYHTVLKIVVEAENGDERTYNISIYRGVTFEDIIDIIDINLIGSDNESYFTSENFDLNTLKYEIVVPYQVINMNLEIDSVGRVYGAGRKQFVNDQIVYTFKVVSQSTKNQTEEYTIIVKREKALEEKTLTDLTVDGITVPNFSPEITTYEIIRAKGATNNKIILNATTKNNAQIQGIGEKTLITGNNTFVISVSSESGSINSYTVNIKYVDSNAFLDNIVVKGSSETKYNEETAKDFTNFTFNPETFEYDVVVDTNTKYIRLTGAAQDQEGARITGFGTYTIGNSEEKIRIFVTSADGIVTQTYTVRVSKYSIPSNNAQLEELSISDQTIGFDKSTYTYKINIGNKVNDLRISAKTFNPNAKIIIEGYEQGEPRDSITLSVDDLEEGRNTILVKVIAEDGVTQSYYRLIVTKEHQPDMLLTILLILSLLLWIITVLVLIIKKSRSKEKDQDELIF